MKVIQTHLISVFVTQITNKTEKVIDTHPNSVLLKQMKTKKVLQSHVQAAYQSRKYQTNTQRNKQSKKNKNEDNKTRQSIKSDQGNERNLRLAQNVNKVKNSLQVLAIALSSFRY